MDCHPIPSRKCTQASGVANFLVMSIRFICGHMCQAQYCSLRPNQWGEDLRGCASIGDGLSSEWRQPTETRSAGFQLPTTGLVGRLLARWGVRDRNQIPLFADYVACRDLVCAN